MAVSSTGRSAEHYRDQLLALLPKGDAWNKDPDGELALLMMGIAEEFALIDVRAQDVLNESHPSQAFEMFQEWEREYGLPDSCSGSDQSFQERRSALVMAYQQNGGQSREFFIEVAALLGYQITITEFKERRFGDQFGDTYGGIDWNYIWRVNASLTNYTERRFGQPFGELYRTWGNQRLECVFRRLVHSHRHIIFSYT